MKNNKLDPHEIANKMNYPLDFWPGNCFSVACQMLVHDIVDGRPCYGHYYGNIAEDSMFAGKELVHHGWIETKDGYIIDPTRWVFESKEPYIYKEKIKLALDYDEGGQRFAKLMMPPIPVHESDKIICEIKDEKMAFLISSMLKRKDVQRGVTIMECHWLGKQPLDMLGDNAKSLYQFMIDNKQSAWIPIDNRHKIMEVDIITPLKMKK